MQVCIIYSARARVFMMLLVLKYLVKMTPAEIREERARMQLREKKRMEQ